MRDHLVYDPTLRVQRPLYYAIIDEVDSILIDEARTLLIIAGKSQLPKNMYKTYDAVIKTLEKDVHYKVDIESKTVSFTEEGIEKIQKILGIDNLYDLKNQHLNHYLMQSMKANTILQKDVDYIVEDNQIKLVDMNT